MQPHTFLILDGSSMLVRAFFATSYGRMSSSQSQGAPTNAVTGFLNMMMKLIQDVQPSHLFVAWDVSRDTFRKNLYPDYKATRGELPIELHPQFGIIQNILDKLGISGHRDENYEADDLIGTMAEKAASDGHHVLVVTGDRDALQLVDAHITVAIMKKGITEMTFYHPEKLLEEWGITPNQICDLKGLMGDTSDNIPGVPGIGEKTALKLLAQFDTIEDMLANPSLLPEKFQKKLLPYHEVAMLSKKLATIVNHVPMPIRPDDCLLTIQLDHARELMAQYHLHRMIRQMEQYQTG